MDGEQGMTAHGIPSAAPAAWPHHTGLKGDAGSLAWSAEGGGDVN